MEEKIVIVNQIGYLINQKKVVLFREGYIGEKFKVVNVDNEKVVYTGEILKSKYSNSAKEKMWVGDFSQVTAEGKYKIVNGEGVESYIFSIGNDIYNKVFKDAVRFFYLQRCGEEIPSEYGEDWAHPECHNTLARIYGSDELIDVSGGWHDAGDYGRYIVATAKAVADLLLAYEVNPKAFTEDLNVPRRDKDMPYILEEVKRQLLWMFKMQNSTNGGVYHKVTCAEFPDNKCMPQDEVGELIVCPISTTATGTFSAVMAMAYGIYKEIDKDFAKKCLAVSKKAWCYLMQTLEQSFKNPDGIVTGEYGSRTDLEERYWAAAQLFKVTGEEEYRQVAEEYAQRELIDFHQLKEIEVNGTEIEKENAKKKLMFTYGWTATGAYADKAYLSASDANQKVCEQIRMRIKQRSEDLLRKANQDGYNIDESEKVYTWGSNMGILMLGLYLKDAYEIDHNDSYLEQAMRYVDYCFGINPLNICYVTEYGSYSPKHTHHRPCIITKKTIPGMLVGGASGWLADEIAEKYLKGVPAAKCYIDHEESYSTNEVDIYWNSILVRILAELKMV